MEGDEDIGVDNVFFGVMNAICFCPLICLWGPALFFTINEAYKNELRSFYFNIACLIIGNSFLNILSFWLNSKI